MSAPRSLTTMSRISEEQENQQHSPSNDKAGHKHADAIDAKFAQLATKTIHELQHERYSGDFFEALDEILREPPQQCLRPLLVNSASHSRLHSGAHRRAGSAKSARASATKKRAVEAAQQPHAHHHAQQNHQRASTNIVKPSVVASNHSNSNSRRDDLDEHHRNLPSRQRMNPIKRSSTVGSAADLEQHRSMVPVRSSGGAKHVADAGGAAPASANATSSNGKVQHSVAPSSFRREIGHLYKPHMNYSTSAMGTHHRLSDDDEIIIIPTTRSPTFCATTTQSQSPDAMEREHSSLSSSLYKRNLNAIATGNDNNNNNQTGDAEAVDGAEDLSERFSISRTKSFWEQLSSNGPSTRRSLRYVRPSEEQPVVGGQQKYANSNNGEGWSQNSREQFLQRLNLQDSRGKQQQQQQQQVITNSNKHSNYHSSNSNKYSSNGNSNHRDSSGNNSNQSCTSSGDENHEVPIDVNTLHQKRNSILIHGREMSRENKFRQTR